MSATKPPVAVVAIDVPPRTVPSLYPEPFASLMARRQKRALGDVFGLSNFGVNLTRISPGGSSALRHAHAVQDEFIYILEGHPTLITDAGETQLAPHMCAPVSGTAPVTAITSSTGPNRMCSISKSAIAVRVTR